METIEEDIVDGFIPAQNEFRVGEIEKMKNEIETEIEKRKKLEKNYKKVSNIFQWSQTGFLSIGLAIAGIGAGGVITNVVSLPLAGFFGTLGLFAAGFTPKLKKKVKKHARIVVDSEAKLMHINNLISKAISDNEISASEFSLIVKEFLKKTATR